MDEEDARRSFTAVRSDRTTESQAKKGTSMRTFITAGAVIALGLSVWGCNGSGYDNQNSGNPTTPTGAQSTSDVVTVNVVGIKGALSFAESSDAPAGQVIVWHNVTPLPITWSSTTGPWTPAISRRAFSQPQTIPADRAISLLDSPVMVRCEPGHTGATAVLRLLRPRGRSLSSRRPGTSPSTASRRRIWMGASPRSYR
jgi:hypothetical protein